MVNYCQGQYGGRLTLESEATVKYNCHAYAWTGRTDVWMNTPEQTKYWGDYSYVTVKANHPGATNYTWSLLSYSGGYLSWGDNGNTLSFDNLSPWSYASFRVSVSNPCGGTSTSDYTFMAQ